MNDYRSNNSNFPQQQYAAGGIGSSAHQQEESQDDDMSPFQNFKQEFQSSLPDSRARQNIQINQQMNKIEELKQEFFVSGGESLISKMGGMLIARAFLPSGAHVKQALSYLDLAVKTELVLNDLQASLFWFSLLEECLFIFSVLLFFTDPTEMVYIWMHILHIGRGVLGYLILKKLPKSHQMAANMSIPSDQNMPFQEIMRYLILAARDAMKDFTAQTKKWLTAYFSLTVICLFLDLIQFFIQVKNFARVQSAFADLAMITIASIFLFMDWFYILWIVSLQFRFPAYISTQFIKGFFGLMEKLTSDMTNYLAQQRGRYDEQYNAEAHNYDYVQKQNKPRANNDIGGIQANYPKPIETSQSEMQ
eukprot:403360058